MGFRIWWCPLTHSSPTLFPSIPEHWAVMKPGGCEIPAGSFDPSLKTRWHRSLYELKLHIDDFSSICYSFRHSQTLPILNISKVAGPALVSLNSVIHEISLLRLRIDQSEKKKKTLTHLQYRNQWWNDRPLLCRHLEFFLFLLSILISILCTLHETCDMRGRGVCNRRFTLYTHNKYKR